MCPLEGYLTLNGESCNHKNDLYMKKCTKCKIKKELTEFNNCKQFKDGKDYNCKACVKERTNDWRNRIKKIEKVIPKTKICIKCKNEKKSCEFTKSSMKKDGLNPYCRPCDKIRARNSYIILKNEFITTKYGEEKLNIRRKKGRERYAKKVKENPELVKQKRRNYYDKNRNTILKKAKIKTREYYKNNKEIIIQKNKEYVKNRLKTDACFRMRKSLGCRIRNIIKKQNTKKVDKTINLIGCSLNELKTYIESLFTKGMTWENHGNNGWHIDHIIPCNNFDLTKKEEQYKCFNYKNLRPLWSTTEIAVKFGEDNNYIGNLNRDRY